jgi:enoyl-CoA hydratase/carnithine racemase
MSTKTITPEALTMAWKMVDTIFPQYHVPAKEQNALLTALTGIALDDLLQSKTVAFLRPLPPMTILVFEGRSVRAKAAAKTRLALKTKPTEADTERAIEWVEEIFDKHRLTEDERATLYTALPCVGLQALKDYLEWKEEPPFAELGEE